MLQAAKYFFFLSRHIEETTQHMFRKVTLQGWICNYLGFTNASGILNEVFLPPEQIPEVLVSLWHLYGSLYTLKLPFFTV